MTLIPVEVPPELLGIAKGGGWLIKALVFLLIARHLAISSAAGGRIDQDRHGLRRLEDAAYFAHVRSVFLGIRGTVVRCVLGGSSGRENGDRRWGSSDAQKRCVFAKSRCSVHGVGE